MEFYLFAMLLVTVTVSILESTSYYKGLARIKNIRFLDGITFIIITAYFIGHYLGAYHG